MDSLQEQLRLGFIQIFGLLSFGLVAYSSVLVSSPANYTWDRLIVEFGRIMVPISASSYLALFAGLSLGQRLARILAILSFMALGSTSVIVFATRTLTLTTYAAHSAAIVSNAILASWPTLTGRFDGLAGKIGQSLYRMSSTIHVLFSSGVKSWGLFFLAGRLSRFRFLYPFLGREMRAGSIYTSTESYLSNALLWTVISVPLVGLILTLMSNLSTTYFAGHFIPLAMILAGGVVLGCFAIYPRYRAGAVKGKIDNNMVYTANFFRILTSSGATPENAFESLARIKDEYGVKSPTRRIVRDIQLLGTDIYSSIQAESERTPSERFAELLKGFVATAKTGGDLSQYFDTSAAKLREDARRSIKKMIDNLTLIGEVYIAALVALPIVLVSILTISGLFGGEIFPGFSSALLLQIIVYFMIPVLAASVLLMIDALAPSSDR